MTLRRFLYRLTPLWLAVILAGGLPTGPRSELKAARAQSGGAVYLPLVRVPPRHVPRVNAPFEVGTTRSAVFWFGQVTPWTNYTDVRVRYYADQLVVQINTIDRRLWFDGSPAASDLTNWDSAAVLLDTNGNIGGEPSPGSYKFIGQINNSPGAANWQAAYRGAGGTWVSHSDPFTSTAGWRGNAMNDGIDDHGWSLKLEIPFTSLGLASAPAAGTTWGLGVVVFDRDASGGGLNPSTGWPTGVAPDRPESWGILHFGTPTFTPPAVPSTGSLTLRQGLNGAEVPDAAAGGHSLCGGAISYWTQWGNLNYAGYEQFNVQNQMDVSDWPCFSKHYITFPLGSLPPNKVILSATLTVRHFGNAGGGQWDPPPESKIQVLTVADPWSEATLTWNNAPPALENIDLQEVPPLATFPGWPGVARTFDVSRAVAEAYAFGEPLRLVLYSADGPRHTGKYFYTSDADTEGRPSLTVQWGDP